MPTKAPTPCSQPGCPALTSGGFCPSHKKARGRQDDARRGTAAQRGYDSRWRRARLAFLRIHPLCAACSAVGQTTPATVVDHVVPHRGDKAKFWAQENWAALCVAHHNAKTAGADGGYGNAPGG